MIGHDTGQPHPGQLLYVTVIHSFLFSKRDLLQWTITAKRDLYSGITYDWSPHRSTASEAASLRYSNPLLFILKKRPITVNDTPAKRDLYSGITCDWSRHRSATFEAAYAHSSGSALYIRKKRPITVNCICEKRPIKVSFSVKRDV